LLARDLRAEIARGEVSVTVLDKSPMAVNQAGFTFVPFGYYTKEDLVRLRALIMISGGDCGGRARGGGTGPEQEGFGGPL